MRNDTRQQFNGYLTRLGELNPGADTKSSFSVDPSVQQRLEQKMREDHSFLAAINVVGVDELKGEVLGIGATRTITSNTDTSGNDERKTIDPTGMDKREYECRKNNFDTHLTYAKLDMWAKFKNFQVLVAEAIRKQQALDRIMIGFNGIKYEKDSDSATYQLLQDVNIGWLQHYRDEAPQRVITDGATAGVIKIGTGGDYQNLDALVMDAKYSLIDEWHRNSDELVVICNSDLYHQKAFGLIDQPHPPTEVIAAGNLLSKMRIGGRPVIEPPFVPDGTMLITSVRNLSIYYQNGKHRRRVFDNPRKDRIENYESSNLAYVIEDLGFGCVIENIKFV